MEIYVLRAPLGRVQGTSPTCWEAAGRGRSVRAWATRTPLLAPSEGGQAPKNQREKPADSSRAGSGEASSGAHGEGEPLGLRAGPAWSCAPCLSARGVWRVPLAPGSAAACLPVLSGQDECSACQVGPALHGGSTPFLFSAGHVPLASPFSARRGDRACRSGSSEGSVLSAGAGGTSEVAAVLAGHEGPGKSPPSQAALPAPKGGRDVPGEGLLVEPPGSPLERWCLRPGLRAGSAWLQAGWRLPRPPPCPCPARPGSGNRDGAEWMLPAVLDLTGERKALPLQQPCLLRLSPVFPRPSTLESLLPRGSPPLHAAALFQRWGLGCS